MPAEQINVTLGTAGHIDHGKTCLIKCLTGCETDRLKEEKQRGMSIDLGFAPCQIAGIEVGIVDVPGHENFVKTMVAGASGMDGVILVVAADDGVMPQTREHLEILTLLGIRHGIIALTKIDRVESEVLEIVQTELREYLTGTFLADAPILPVSNVTGEGLSAFADVLSDLVQSIQPKRVDGVFRVPVDRSFSVKGYGTVVSGIPVAGSARVGDEIVLLPQDLPGRIKAIQVYGRDADTVMAGQCAALNVREWDHRSIERGDTLTLPGYFAPQAWCACRLRLLPHEKLSLKNAAHVRFHTGTAETQAAIYVMQGERMAAGEEALVQVKLERPLLAGPGDRFIVRTLSPVRTIGGGVIIETAGKRLKRSRPGLVQDLAERGEVVNTDEAFVAHCVKTADGMVTLEQALSVRAKVLPARLREILDALVEEGTVIRLPSGSYMHAETARQAGQRVIDAVGEFHQQSPESPGPTLDALIGSCGMDKSVLQQVVVLLKGEGRLAERHQRVALPEHRETFGDADRTLLDGIEALFRDRAFRPPGVDEVVEHAQTPRDRTTDALKVLIEHERLVQVAPDLLFHVEAVARARDALVDHIRAEGKLESVKFKYLIDTTRKFAIPLLDYFDKIGLTRRVSNTRYLSPSAQRDGG